MQASLGSPCIHTSWGGTRGGDEYIAPIGKSGSKMVAGLVGISAIQRKWSNPSHDHLYPAPANAVLRCQDFAVRPSGKKNGENAFHRFHIPGLVTAKVGP